MSKFQLVNAAPGPGNTFSVIATLGDTKVKLTTRSKESLLYLCVALMVVEAEVVTDD